VADIIGLELHRELDERARQLLAAVVVRRERSVEVRGADRAGRSTLDLSRALDLGASTGIAERGQREPELLVERRELDRWGIGDPRERGERLARDLGARGEVARLEQQGHLVRLRHHHALRVALIRGPTLDAL